MSDNTKSEWQNWWQQLWVREHPVGVPGKVLLINNPDSAFQEFLVAQETQVTALYELQDSCDLPVRTALSDIYAPAATWLQVAPVRTYARVVYFYDSHSGPPTAALQAALLRVADFNGVVYHVEAGAQDRWVSATQLPGPGWLLSSYPRCGTHMLLSALQQHTQLTTYGEVLNPTTRSGMARLATTPVEIGYLYWATPQTGFAVHAHRWRRTPGVLRGNDANITAFYDWCPRDVKIISLRCRNHFRQQMSYKLAKQSDIWNTYSASALRQAAATEAQVQFVPQELRRAQHSAENVWRVVDEIFQNVLPVYYEDLCADWEQEIIRVQEFLGVDVQPVTPTSQKLHPSIFEQLTNPGEARQWLKQHAPTWCI